MHQTVMALRYCIFQENTKYLLITPLVTPCFIHFSGGMELLRWHRAVDGALSCCGGTELLYWQLYDSLLPV